MRDQTAAKTAGDCEIGIALFLSQILLEAEHVSHHAHVAKDGKDYDKPGMLDDEAKRLLER